MGGQRRAEGLSAVLLLLTACCALPVPPGEEDDSGAFAHNTGTLSVLVLFLRDERPKRRGTTSPDVVYVS